MSRLEKTIEREANKAIRSMFGMKNWKSESLEIGFPDRMYRPPTNARRNKGKVCFIEWKRPGEAPRPEQENRIKQLRAAKVPVEVFDNVSGAIDWITKLYYGGKQSGKS